MKITSFCWGSTLVCFVLFGVFEPKYTFQPGFTPIQNFFLATGGVFFFIPIVIGILRANWDWRTLGFLFFGALVAYWVSLSFH